MIDSVRVSEMDDKSDLTAVVLAGGLGTRLRSVVEDQPKVLAQVGGNPFLKYLLDQLAGWRIREVVLCTGYLGEQVESQFGADYRGMRLIYSREPAPLGTGGALRLALPLIKSGTVLVLNGDSYCEADFDAFWRWHRLQGSAATLMLVNTPDTQRFGTVRIDENRQVISFEEKKDGAEPGLINAGVYLIDSHLLKSIPDSRQVSLEREIFPAWIGKNFYGYQGEGSFLDIGTPESYALAEAFFTKVMATVK